MTNKYLEKIALKKTLKTVSKAAYGKHKVDGDELVHAINDLHGKISTGRDFHNKYKQKTKKLKAKKHGIQSS